MFLAVALGAFGAHALRGRIGEDLLAIFETGVRYQAYHALALLALAAWAAQFESAAAGRAAWLFSAGIVVFSGSLYALALTGIRKFGAVTPIGGLMFLAGWFTLLTAGWKR
ncbi:MAG: DUF423 domain-containing protein [Elusimicrobia bacterium]|nr:DUF423 domain-containing protein [Elusimicrobiota bacterium]